MIQLFNKYDICGNSTPTSIPLYNENILLLLHYLGNLDKGIKYPGCIDTSLSDLPPFPREFWWGVATSSYQVEGHVEGCGKPWISDWDIFTSIPAIIDRVRAMTTLVGTPITLSNPSEAVHHSCTDIFREDVERAKSLGINTYRVSLEWSRIQPNPPKHRDAAQWVDGDDFDQETVSRYLTMINTLIEHGIRPVITLNHMTLPTWVLTPPTRLIPDPATSDKPFMNSLQGWEDDRTVDAYLKFVEFIVRQFKDRVHCWLTLNEPVGSMIGVGYLAGIWPPGFILDGVRAKKAYFNLIKAHVRAYDKIKEIAGLTSIVGFAHAVVYPKIASSDTPFVQSLNRDAKEQFEYFYTHHFLTSVVSGVVDIEINVDPSKQKNLNSEQFFGIEVEKWSPKLDFIGVNYYRSVYVYYHPVIAFSTASFSGGIFDNDLRQNVAQPHNLLNDLGWEIYPEGFYLVLKSLNEKYKLPILITENGLPERLDGPDKNGIRAPYIVAHLQQLLRAIKEGVKIIGYIHWTLLDNFEWQEDYKDESRFGLYRVDRNADYKNLGLRTYPRLITNGATALQYIIKEGNIADAVKKYGTISPSGDRVIPSR